MDEVPSKASLKLLLSETSSFADNSTITTNNANESCDSSSAYSGDEDSENSTSNSSRSRSNVEKRLNRKRKTHKQSKLSAHSSHNNVVQSSSKRQQCSSGHYSEFENFANGIDEYTSQSDDDEIGANEARFDLRRNQYSSPNTSPSSLNNNNEVVTSKMRQNRVDKGDEHQHATDKAVVRNELMSDIETLDIEDALCVVREGFGNAPPLANEENFEDEID
ncbi:unnamed protein product [Anisakis simplex]|uniref:Suppressor protein SRP40-like n=1 Tax=Anisakis simplex TaxID=6269 RepID=A0A158PNP1_ANISI|nr:unnamed protein product [Anisakis simplex]